MKLIGFVCALALAGAIGGCGDDDNGTGTGGTGGGTGGSAGSGGGTGGTAGGGTGGTAGGGTGGTSGDGFCQGADDMAVFANFTYTDEANETLAGDEAVAAVGGDCVFGATTLVSDGCFSETQAVLQNNNDENRAALGACVGQCIIDQGAGLSAECISCYEDSVVCGAANCAAACATGTDEPACIACRCGGNPADENCFQNFADCSGFPPSDDCN